MARPHLTAAFCPPGARGFTIVEVLVALSLGAVLLIAMASAAGTFVQAVSYLEDDTANGLDEALARVARDVRYAWWVEVPNPTRLRVVHADGGSTEYYRNGSDLMVQLPDGRKGTLASGLKSLAFTAQTVQRLREGKPTRVPEALVEVATPAKKTATALEILDGESLALAFSRGSASGLKSVDGVAEQVLDYTPTSFHLPIAGTAKKGDLLFDLLPARAPGSAQPLPGAAALASGVVAIADLPKAKGGKKDKGDKKKDKKKKKKDKKGGKKGGKKGDDRALALAAAWAWPPAAWLLPLGPAAWVTPFAAKVKYDPPTAHLSFGIGAWAGATLYSPLEASSSYTLVLTVRGNGSSVVVPTYPDGSGADPGAVSTGKGKKGSETWTPLTVIVPWGLAGDARVSSTTATPAVASVRIDATATDGSSKLRSASVYNQVLVEGPWLGVVPGEAAPADL